jgi:hypothetical protein
MTTPPRKKTVSTEPNQDMPWDEEDREYVKGLVEKALRCQRIAYFEKSDLDLLQAVQDLLLGILIIKGLLSAFRQSSPDYNIKGAGGVAEQLGLSRNGVYCRLEKVGLDPVDFHGPKAQVGRLVKKSPRLRRLIAHIEALSETERPRIK